MPMRKVFSKSGTLTADTQWELDPLALRDEILVVVSLTGNSGGTTPTLNARLQARFADGIWTDRISFAQLTDSDNSGEVRKAVIQEFGTFADAEELYEPSGSSGASRLTAGSVINGPFPPIYRGNVTGGVGANNFPGANWRLDFDLGGDTPTWPIQVDIYANSLD